MRSIIARLTDARNYAGEAAAYVDHIGLAEFSADSLRQHAVSFCLVVVGEACTEAAKGLAERAPEIPWAKIKGMRNILVHEYWQIDEEIVYNVARDDAELLAASLDRLLEEIQVP
jgi:uncharacterized protein with HEPN domain